MTPMVLVFATEQVEVPFNNKGRLQEDQLLERKNTHSVGCVEFEVPLKQ